MSSFLHSSPSSSVQSSSPSHKDLVSHPESRFSPLRLKEQNRALARERLQKRREEAALNARGGFETMGDNFIYLQLQEEKRELERRALDYETRPEDYEELENELNSYHIADESDLLDSILMEEEEEIRFLVQHQELELEREQQLAAQTVQEQRLATQTLQQQQQQ